MNRFSAFRIISRKANSKPGSTSSPLKLLFSNPEITYTILPWRYTQAFSS